MKISAELFDGIIELLNNEVVPAEGCTEPIAIAYAAAKAVEVLGCAAQKIEVIVSGNIVKNVKSVVVPNTAGMVGIEAAAAVGAVAGDANKKLLVINEVDTTVLPAVKALIPQITVTLSDKNVTLYIKVVVQHGNEEASVELQDYHTNITEITQNGQIVFQAPLKTQTAEDFAEKLSIKTLYYAAQQVDVERIKPLFERVMACNLAIAHEGLTHPYGVGMGKQIQDEMSGDFYAKDLRNISASLASAGSDARMAGCALPVMTTAGSGNVGLSASLPLIAYCQEKNIAPQQLYQALFFSHLTTVYIKSKIGRLSAYCGPMCAAAGVAGALCLLKNASLAVIEMAITNALAGISGIVCDGANSSCAVKIANAVYAAYDAAALALHDHCVAKGDGLVGNNVEETIANIGKMAKQGMKRTDTVILDIMTHPVPDAA